MKKNLSRLRLQIKMLELQIAAQEIEEEVESEEVVVTPEEEEGETSGDEASSEGDDEGEGEISGNGREDESTPQYYLHVAASQMKVPFLNESSPSCIRAYLEARDIYEQQHQSVTSGKIPKPSMMLGISPVLLMQWKRFDRDYKAIQKPVTDKKLKKFLKSKLVGTSMEKMQVAIEDLKFPPMSATSHPQKDRSATWFGSIDKILTSIDATAYLTCNSRGTRKKLWIHFTNQMGLEPVLKMAKAQILRAIEEEKLLSWSGYSQASC
jgi:hypothetical protein